MIEKSENTGLLMILVNLLEIRGTQLVEQNAAPLTRYFRDATETSIRLAFMRNLGIKDRSLCVRFLNTLGQTGPIEDFYDIPSLLHKITDEESETLFRVEGELVRHWPDVRIHFPMSRGVISLGIPCYNDARDLACVYFGQILGPLVGQFAIQSFRKTPLGWISQEKFVLGVS